MKAPRTPEKINQQKMDQLQTTLDRLLRQALQRGFDGKVRVELNVYNGTIWQIQGGLEQVRKALPQA